MRLRSIVLLVASSLAIAILALAFKGPTVAAPPAAPRPAGAESVAAPPPSDVATETIRRHASAEIFHASDAPTRLVVRWPPIEKVTIGSAKVSIRHSDRDWHMSELVASERGTDESGHRFEGVTIDGVPPGTVFVRLGPYRLPGGMLPEFRVAWVAERRVEIPEHGSVELRVALHTAMPVHVHLIDSHGADVSSCLLRMIEPIPCIDLPLALETCDTSLAATPPSILFRSFPNAPARIRVTSPRYRPTEVVLEPGARELRIELEELASLDVAADGVTTLDGFHVSLASGERRAAGDLRADPDAGGSGSVRCNFSHCGAGVWDVVLYWRSRRIGVLGTVTLGRCERRAVRLDASRFGFLPVTFRVDSTMAPPGSIEIAGVTTGVRRMGTIEQDRTVEVRLPRDRYRVLLRNGRDLWPADRELVVDDPGDAGVLRFR